MDCGLGRTLRAGTASGGLGVRSRLIGDRQQRDCGVRRRRRRIARRRVSAAGRCAWGDGPLSNGQRGAGRPDRPNFVPWPAPLSQAALRAPPQRPVRAAPLPNVPGVGCQRHSATAARGQPAVLSQTLGLKSRPLRVQPLRSPAGGHREYHCHDPSEPESPVESCLPVTPPGRAGLTQGLPSPR